MLQGPMVNSFALNTGFFPAANILSKYFLLYIKPSFSYFVCFIGSTSLLTLVSPE